MQKLKNNDEVVVLAGKDRGKRGSILRIDRKRGRVLVKGINLLRKSVKPTQEKSEGGFDMVERMIHISNVAFYSDKKGCASRVRIEEKNGKRMRIAVKCGTILK